MERHWPFGAEQAEICNRNSGGRCLSLGGALHDIPRREAEADMLVEAGRLARKSSRMAELPILVLETTQQFEEVEGLRERRRLF